MKHFRCTLFLLGFLFMRVVPAYPLEQSRRIEEEKRKSLEKTELQMIKGEKKLLFDYGGWMQLRYNDYNDDDNDSTTLDTLDYTYSGDLRFWLKATFTPSPYNSYENKHFFYLRIKNLFIDRIPRDEEDAGYDNDGPHIDYAYAILDYRPFWLEVGRKYFTIGEGIVYSDVNDGIQMQLRFSQWNLKTFISHTLPHEENIDTSVPGYLKESDRYFWGFEALYQPDSSRDIYAYLLLERDFSNEDPPNVTQQYTYNSRYLGIGTHGSFVEKLNYAIELIKEGGTSYIFTPNEKKDIDAWGADVEVSYDCEVITHPKVSFEYAFGSGDPDRINVTDTEEGNSSGDDKNFLYFGYHPTGFALSPRLSNIHLYRIGVDLKPLEKSLIFNNLQLEMNYFRFYKDKSTGGISDLDATEDSDDIGDEFDLSISWQVFSDLNWSFQYGRFRPGEAYPEANNDNDDYFSTSLTLTF